jgi:protein deglycase
MAKTVLVPLMPGFEEIEAVTLIDVLRRAEVRVIIAADAVGPVTGAHGIAVTAEQTIDAVTAKGLDMIVLPGGMPGAQHLKEHARVQALITELAAAGKYTAAICAAPMALAAAGIHRGKRVTCYPGFEKYLAGGELVTERVVVDGKLATSRGPGTAMEFSLALIELLEGASKAASVRDDLLAR